MRRLVLLLVTSVACSSESPVGDAVGGGGVGGTVSQLTLPAGMGGRPGSTSAGSTSPTFDQNCGNSASAMTPLPADLLLVLDRSGSMTNDIASDDPCDPASGACAERWSTMTKAMQQVLAASSASIAWGLKLFSTPGPATAGAPEGCGVAPGVEVGIGPGNGNAIVSVMGATTPNYNTPTRAAIQAATAYLAGVHDNHAKYILLATDGQPNCPAAGDVATASDLPAALQAIADAHGAGIAVYVIGVGPSAGNLDEMARQGGTGAFYPALSPQSLVAALDAIVGAVASCVYTMSAPPPDPSNLGVYLDKKAVPRSTSDGWSLAGTTSIVFSGPTCDRIKAGSVGSVDVLFGCPGTSALPTVIP